MRGLPAEGRRINGAFTWMMGIEYAPPPEPTPGALAGIGASAGQYTGPVRVIRSEAEFGRIRPGDVLVCPVTTPVWSVLFSSASALVTDGGSILSHAAIIAREHNIPAVVATGTATSDLRDGQVVTVDGTRGTVEPAE
ncbi:MAG: PEP-utilizing enzyme [Dehalococcoidia bacterium]|nr:PEP-utilizing enzyme [Dehalococcoidia bacterium]